MDQNINKKDFHIFSDLLRVSFAPRMIINQIIFQQVTSVTSESVCKTKTKLPQTRFFLHVLHFLSIYTDLTVK